MHNDFCLYDNLGANLCYHQRKRDNPKVIDNTIYTFILVIVFFGGTVAVQQRYFEGELKTEAKATIAFDEAAKLAAPKGYQVTEFYAPINIFRTRKIFIKYAVPERPSNFSKYYDEMTAKNYWVKTGTAGQYEKGSLSLEIKPDDEHGTCSVEVTCP